MNMAFELPFTLFYMHIKWMNSIGGCHLVDLEVFKKQEKASTEGVFISETYFEIHQEDSERFILKLQHTEWSLPFLIAQAFLKENSNDQR